MYGARVISSLEFFHAWSPCSLLTLQPCFLRAPQARPTVPLVRKFQWAPFESLASPAAPSTFVGAPPRVHCSSAMAALHCLRIVNQAVDRNTPGECATPNASLAFIGSIPDLMPQRIARGYTSATHLSTQRRLGHRQRSHLWRSIWSFVAHFCTDDARDFGILLASVVIRSIGQCAAAPRFACASTRRACLLLLTLADATRLDSLVASTPMCALPRALAQCQGAPNHPRRDAHARATRRAPPRAHVVAHACVRWRLGARTLASCGSLRALFAHPHRYSAWRRSSPRAAWRPSTSSPRLSRCVAAARTHFRFFLASLAPFISCHSPA